MKILLCILAISLIISGCTANNSSPIRTIEPSVTPGTQSQDMIDTAQSDKINDTTYAGKLTKLTDTEITIVMDGKTTEVFKLNDKAKRDIEILKIEVDDRIIIVFDSPESRNITAVQKIRSEL